MILTEAVIVAIITGSFAIVSNFVIAIMNSKLMIYRIEQLEAKVTKHNELVERVTVLEQNDKAQWRYIDQFKEEIERE